MANNNNTFKHFSLKGYFTDTEPAFYHYKISIII